MSILIPLLLTACGAGKVECPKFNPNGLYELKQSAAPLLASVLRDGSESVGSSSTLPVESGDLEPFDWDPSSKQITIGDIEFDLKRNKAVACDAPLKAGELNGAWTGEGILFTGPGGTLSDSIRDVSFDLQGNDCNLSIESGVDAAFQGSGEKANFSLYQTLRFDDSDSCIRALERVKEEIYNQRIIPALFFDWAYAGAIELDRLEQLESLEFNYEIRAVKVDDAPATDTGDTADAGDTGAEASPKSRQEGPSKLKQRAFGSRFSAAQIRELSAKMIQ